MADMVIDEWLWADLAGVNSTEKQKQSFTFLEAVFKKCDRIVSVKGSRFEEKAVCLWKHTDVARRKIARFYMECFQYNSDKTVLLEEEDLHCLPELIATDIEERDQYLVRAYLTAGASIVVTTDTDLKNALAKHNLQCEYRDEFVSNYISQYRHK